MKKKIILLLLCATTLQALPPEEETKFFISVSIGVPLLSIGAGYAWLQKLQPRKPFIILNPHCITIDNKQQVRWGEITDVGSRTTYYYDANGYKTAMNIVYIDYKRETHQDSVLLEEEKLPMKTGEFVLLLKEFSTGLEKVTASAEILSAPTLSEEERKQVEKTGIYKNKEKHAVIVYTPKPSWIKMLGVCAICYPLIAGGLYYFFTRFQAYSRGQPLCYNRPSR